MAVDVDSWVHYARNHANCRPSANPTQHPAVELNLRSPTTRLVSCTSVADAKKTDWREYEIKIFPDFFAPWYGTQNWGHPCSNQIPIT